jgi:hypothetical protein
MNALKFLSLIFIFIISGCNKPEPAPEKTLYSVTLDGHQNFSVFKHNEQCFLYSYNVGMVNVKCSNNNEYKLDIEDSFSLNKTSFYAIKLNHECFIYSYGIDLKPLKCIDK